MTLLQISSDGSDKDRVTHSNFLVSGIDPLAVARLICSSTMANRLCTMAANRLCTMATNKLNAAEHRREKCRGWRGIVAWPKGTLFGTRYTGAFENDQQSGAGKYESVDGYIFSGTWAGIYPVVGVGWAVLVDR